MMPSLVKRDDVRSERRAEAHHGRLWSAQESMGQQIGLPLRGRPILLPLLWLQTELDSTQSYYHYKLALLNRKVRNVHHLFF